MMRKTGGSRKLAPVPAPVVQHRARAVPTAVAPPLAQDGVTRANVHHLSCTAWSTGWWLAGRSIPDTPQALALRGALVAGDMTLCVAGPEEAVTMLLSPKTRGCHGPH